jgi:Methyltransferase domain
MITHHTQLLNALIEKYELKSYLEIGVQTPEQNFDKIRCGIKVGVDPEIQPVFMPGHICTEKTDKNEIGDYLNYYELNNVTSDEFFANGNKAWADGPRRGFDLVFIDGLHHADQVKRDFENSLRCLSDTGFILIHDVLPENESGTLVPRVQRQWWGNVYKWAMDIQTYDGIRFKTFNIDNGCMLVCKDSKVKSKFQPLPTTWEGYLDYGHKLMNVTNEVTI